MLARSILYEAGETGLADRVEALEKEVGRLGVTNQALAEVVRLNAIELDGFMKHTDRNFAHAANLFNHILERLKEIEEQLDISPSPLPEFPTPAPPPPTSTPREDEAISLRNNIDGEA